MRICPSCGERVKFNAKYCSVCGTKVENKSEDSSFQAKVDDFVNDFTNTADTTAEYSSADINKNRHMALLAYFGIFFLVPLISAKESPFARYHTNQGIMLFLVQMLGVAITQIPKVGWILAAIVSVLSGVLFVIGVMNAVKGKAKELPLIGKVRMIK